MSSWKLGDAKKLSLIERGAKNENFKIFVLFCLNFIFFNIVSQFWTQKYSNEPKTTSLASVFVEKSSVEILGGAEIRPFWKKIDLKANF